MTKVPEAGEVCLTSFANFQANVVKNHPLIDSGWRVRRFNINNAK